MHVAAHTLVDWESEDYPQTVCTRPEMHEESTLCVCFVSSVGDLNCTVSRPVAPGVLGCLRSPLAPQVFGVLGISWSESCAWILDCTAVCMLRLGGRLLCLCLVERVFLGVLAPPPPFFGCPWSFVVPNSVLRGILWRGFEFRSSWWAFRFWNLEPRLGHVVKHPHGVNHATPQCLVEVP